MVTNAPIVKLESVVKVYGSVVKTRALDGVSFSINQGEFVSICGPSGSGKSTLLNLLGALDRPSEGVVEIGGVSLSALSPDELANLRRKHLGFVFQFHYLLPEFSALENVLMPTVIEDGGASDERTNEAIVLLEQVGLAGLSHRFPNQLSGGQQQRVAIARALARHKSIVLADEPTGNLDTENSEDAFQLMVRFNREKGQTFLIVTHDPALAARTDRMIFVRDGKVAFDGPPSEFSTDRD